MRARCALEHHLVRFDADDEEVTPRPDGAQQPVHELLRAVPPVQLRAAQQVVPSTNNAAAVTLTEHSKQEGPRCSRHHYVEVPSAHEGLVLPIPHDDLGVRA